MCPVRLSTEGRSSPHPELNVSHPARSEPKLRLLPTGEETLALKEYGESESPDVADAMSPSAGRVHPLRRNDLSGPLASLPDAELVVLGAQGNRKALEWLYRRHAPFAIRLATRIEGSARDVDDVVHDAFLKAFERLQDLSEPSAFRGWLGSIIVRDVRSHMRRAKLMRTLGLIRCGEAIDLDALASADASPSVRAQIAQVYALLRTQPVDERIAWILRAVEGHDLESVARMTSCSLATAKRRIARVQKFLDEHFVDSYTEQGEP